jgi:iron uptake system EfeUOB component EfeO/EfeM
VRDPNVEIVIQKYRDRAKVGFEKYGVNTERDDIDLMGWLTHLQEELMDATIYIQRLKKEINNGN